MNKLSSTELQFMELIWEHPEGISSSDIYEQFPQSLSAKSTLLSRIVKKGVAVCERKGKQVYYHAVMSKREYEKTVLQDEIQKSLGFSSFQKLFAAFCGKQDLTKTQIEQLKELVEKLENDR